MKVNEGLTKLLEFLDREIDVGGSQEKWAWADTVRALIPTTQVTTNRRQPLPGMDLWVQRLDRVTLSPAEVDKVFMRRLSDLTEGLFMRDGFLWRSGEDQMGHDWEEKVAPVEDGRYALAIQALRFRAALIEASV